MSYENVPKNKTEQAVLVRGGRPDYFKLAAAAFPVPTADEAGAILEVTDTGDRYRWTSTAWVKIERAGNVITADFLLEIAKGNVPGHTTGTIFGRNQDIDPAAAEMVWDYGGLEVYLTANTELFLSSSSASDIDVGVFVWGMTDDYVFKQEIHTFTAGQSQQSIGNFFRIFRLVIVSGSAPLGDIYCAEADTLTAGVPNTAALVHALMAVGTGITHKVSGTVPAGYEMHVVRMFMGVRRAEDVVFQFRQKAFGSPMFIESSSFPLYQASQFLTFSPPFVIDEKTDFDFLAVTVTNNTEAILNLAYILIDKDFI